MIDKCQVCYKEKREKGRFYITTKLVGKTTKIEGLKLCKKHSDNLSTQIWDLIFQILRGVNIDE